MLMTPASSYHSALQVELATRLKAIAGRAFVAASMLTSAGVLVADVAWASAEFMRAHGFETPYTRALDMCPNCFAVQLSQRTTRED